MADHELTIVKLGDRFLEIHYTTLPTFMFEIVLFKKLCDFLKDSHTVTMT